MVRRTRLSRVDTLQSLWDIAATSDYAGDENA